ncbi:O-antigen polymerase [Eubacterium maltosivorans]|uniref:O-antigen polymerase n=1 Tax=Eubacterium maltosivorans TaxID=2041044 RepID=UPI00189F3511|nr:O-antigen polymerase [Eubacterium maltosivorans]
MLIFLFLTLIIFTLLVLVVNNGDFLDPLCLSCEVFTFSTFIALLNQKTWQLEFFSAKTYFTIILALVFFGIGEIIIKIFFSKKLFVAHKEKRIMLLSQTPINLSKKLTLGISLMMLVGALQILKKTYEISLQVGNTDGVMGMLASARVAYIYTDLSLGTDLAIFSFLINAMGYIFTFILVYNTVHFGKRSFSIITVFPIVVFFFTAALGTGRTVFIRYIVVIITMSVLFVYQKKNIQKTSVPYLCKLIILVFLALIIFFTFFQILGIFTGKTGNLTAWDTFSIYTGSSISAFNNFITNYRPVSHFWGNESFYGIYGILNKFSSYFPNESIHLDFVYFTSIYKTNVYTSLRSYIYDFGFIGMCVIQLLIGMAFSFCYMQIRKKRNNFLSILIYGYFNYGLVMQGIEDTLFRSFMSITQIFELFFIIIIYIFLIKPKIFIKNDSNLVLSNEVKV